VISVISNKAQSAPDAPTFALRDFEYVAHENASGALDRISYVLSSDVTTQEGLKDVRVDLAIEIPNPGTQVSFTIPDTAGYTKNQ
jgi:hypothetical protein